MAKTNAQKQDDYRRRKEAAGLVEFRCWCTEEEKELLHATANRMASWRREKHEIKMLKENKGKFSMKSDN